MHAVLEPYRRFWHHNGIKSVDFACGCAETGNTVDFGTHGSFVKMKLGSVISTEKNFIGGEHKLEFT